MKIGDLISVDNPIKSIDIAVKLPTDWDQFGEGSDMIKGLDFNQPMNGTCVMYSADAGSTFDWHKHDSIETCVIYGDCEIYFGESLEDGSLKVTEKVVIVNFGSVTIQKDVPHYFRFNTHCELLIGWYPKFKVADWGATFFNPTEKSKRDYKILDALTLGAEKLFR